MMLKRISVVVLMCGTIALAQPRSGSAPERTGKTRAGEVIGNSELLQKLGSDDAATRQQMIELIKERLATMPSRIADSRPIIFKTLMTGKHYAEVVDLAWYSIVTVPHDTRGVELSQQQRVKALLALGKTEEALQGAKSLFNVASMTGTSDSILIVAECLNAARAKDKEIFNKFREEQMAGATSQVSGTPAQIAAAKGARSSALDSIKVDSKPYDDALAKMTGEDYQSLMGRGNLLLMADHVKDARDVFERMYSLASASELVEASEALARLIRAEDGTIGRANAWVLSIRPKPAATTQTTPPPAAATPPKAQ
jgi:hypothetical protein